MNTGDARARRSRAAAVAAGLLLLAHPAQGNEFGGQGAYRLSDAGERQARANLLDLRERKRGGGFEFNQTTNIDRQINCNFSVAATGNAAQPTHAGAGIAPVGIQDSGISPSATGNHSTSENSSQGQIGDSRSDVGGTQVAGALTGGSRGRGHADSGLADQRQSASGGNLNQVHQGNEGTTLSSSVSGSPMHSQIGAISANGAEILNALDTTQSNEGSEILATVTESGACEFGETPL